MTAPMIPTGYRKNVAVVVIDDRGRVLACHRSDVSGAWQLPQGGVDEDEPLDHAMRRELEEEIGTSEIDIIGRLPQPIRYEWPSDLYPRGYRGQEQYYYLVRLRPTAVIDLTAHEPHEFDRVEWVSTREFLRRISSFKAAAYTTAIEQLCAAYPGAISMDAPGENP